MKLPKALFILTLCLKVYAGEKPGETINSPEDLFERRGRLEIPGNSFKADELEGGLSSEFTKERKELEKIKYYLLNGEARLARAYLSKLQYIQSEMRPIVNRYLAILSFIEGDFQKSYEYLSLKELQKIPEFGKICVLKTLTEVVLNKINSLNDTWSRCKVNNARFLNESHLLWPEMIVQFKLNPKGGMTKIPFNDYRLSLLSNEDTKIILKLALYLNQEDLLIDQIPELSMSQLQDPEIRELAGQIFFRKGSLVKSYNFIEDLESPNAENIKGNLHLLKGNYENAYKQFKVALNQKPNSQNALERLLPLSWVLGDWKNAFSYAHELSSSDETIANKLTLLSAFSIQSGDYEQTNKFIQKILGTSPKGSRLEVSQIASFTSLMLKDENQTRKQSLKSCEQYDLINCWMLFQLSQWENFSLTIKRDDEIIHQKEWENLIKDDLDAPLKENIYINQMDVEELDDKLIQLLPKR